MSANNFTLKGMKTMTKTTNRTVTLHYQGTLEDGTVFDSSRDRGEPMTVTTGAGQLISGFENAISTMETGETKTFTLEPEDAYGPRFEDRTTTLNKDVFPEDFTFEENMQIPLQGPQGPLLSTLLEGTDTEITVDLNHPMAGKTLTFEVEVLNVEDTNS
jgi:peptidylprolyl isomerase